MSVSAISSAGCAHQQTRQASPYKQARQDYDALAQALAAGNIQAAQQAYAAFQQDLQTVQQKLGVQPSVQAVTSAQHGGQADMDTLGQALSSGDLNSAQNAFANLQQDIQNVRQGETGQVRHHHHHGSGTQTASAVTDTNTSSSSSGSGINTTA